MTVYIYIPAHIPQCRSSTHSFVKVCFPKYSIRESALTAPWWILCVLITLTEETAAVLAVLPTRTRRAAGQGSAHQPRKKSGSFSGCSSGLQIQNESGDLATAPTTRQKIGKKKLDENKIPPRANINCSGDLMEEMSHISSV